MKTSKLYIALLLISIFGYSQYAFAQSTVIWASYDEAVESPNGLTVPTAVYQDWANGAVAYNQLLTEEDGWVGQLIPENIASCSYAFGWTYAEEPVGDLNNLAFAFAFTGGDVLVYENGSLLGLFGQVVSGDSVKIERLGPEMFFYINDGLVLQLPVSSSIPLYIGTSLGTADCEMGFLSSSQIPPIIATPSITHISCQTHNAGVISLDIIGGTAPYGVEWKQNGTSLGQGTAITGLAEGTYTAEIIDASGMIIFEDITISSASVWANIQDGQVVGDSIIASVEGACRAVSENRLLADEAGWMEWIFDGSSNHYVGLSSSDNLNLGPEGISFAFSALNGAELAIYESGGFVGVFGELNIGDVLRIERDIEGIIYYYHNGAEVLSTLSTVGQDLLIRVEVPTGAVTSSPYSSFGCGSFVFECD